MLTIGDVARKAGLSERALRLYEAEGLLNPGRSESGRRLYCAGDLARVQQIQLLKKAGLTLAQIGDLMRQQRLDPAMLLDLQLAALEQQKGALDQAIGALKAAKAKVVAGQFLDVDALCDLIKLGEDHMTQDNWQQVYDRYYSQEDQAKWRAAKEQFFPQTKSRKRRAIGAA
jgi:MerR family transcriptional regulator, thiopeptide resistance regulator